MDKLQIPVLLGTSRKLRKSVFVAHWLMGEIAKRADIESRLFDVSDFDFPSTLR